MVVEFKPRGYRRTQQDSQPPVNAWTPLLVEFVGTLIFTLFTIGGVAIGQMTGELRGAAEFVPRGLIIVALIYAFGAASGAHFNPAVTLAFAVRGAFPWSNVPRYWLMQFLGALAGAFIFSFSFGGLDLWPPLKLTQPQAIFYETLFSFVLISVVLSTSRQDRLIGHNAALAVGATLTVIGMLGGPLTVGIVNPAKALAPALVSGDLSNLWLFFVGPFAGALLAVWMAHVVHGQPNPREEEAALGRHVSKAREGNR